MPEREVAGAQHPEAAQVWLDFIRSTELQPAGMRELCSLMGQGGALAGFRRRGMPVFSARSRALDGVSWVQGGLVEIAVGRGWPRATQSAPSSAPSLGRRSLRELDAVSCLVDRWPKPARTRFRSATSRA